MGDISEKKEFDMNYDNDEENETKWTRGGMGYWLPAGFKGKAVDVGSFSQWEDAIVGFHGTTLETAKLILQDRFKLPSELPGGVKDGHIELGEEVYGIDNWADAVFLSPSHKYTMAPHYGGGSTLKKIKGMSDVFVNMSSVDQEGNLVFCMLQCRIKKEGLSKDPSTGKRVFSGTSGEYDYCDHRISSDEMEYHVKDPKNLQPYRLLLRTMSVTEWNSGFIDDE